MLFFVVFFFHFIVLILGEFMVFNATFNNISFSLLFWILMNVPWAQRVPCVVNRGIPFKGCYNTKCMTVDHSGERARKVPRLLACPYRPFLYISKKIMGIITTTKD